MGTKVTNNRTLYAESHRSATPRVWLLRKQNASVSTDPAEVHPVSPISDHSGTALNTQTGFPHVFQGGNFLEPKLTSTTPWVFTLSGFVWSPAGLWDGAEGGSGQFPWAFIPNCLIQGGTFFCLLPNPQALPTFPLKQLRPKWCFPKGKEGKTVSRLIKHLGEHKWSTVLNMSSTISQNSFSKLSLDCLT